MFNLCAFTVPSTPHNTWGANRPGNLDSPLSPVEEDGERETERPRYDDAASCGWKPCCRSKGGPPCHAPCSE